MEFNFFPSKWDNYIKPASEASRLIVANKFGVPIVAQLRMEEYFKSMSALPEGLEIPCLDLVVPQCWRETWDDYVITDNMVLNKTCLLDKPAIRKAHPFVRSSYAHTLTLPHISP